MKQIICEICGNSNLVKQDGLFVCQSCGAKYTPDQARALMVETDPYAQQEAPVYQEAPMTQDETTGLIKRALLFLEDGAYDRADEICEQLLNRDPENAEIYLIKLMAQMQVSSVDQLALLHVPFDSFNSYQKIMRFGSPALKDMLMGYIEGIKTRNEYERLMSIYLQGMDILEKSTDPIKLKSAAKLFETIESFKDSADRKEECLERSEKCRKDRIYESAVKEMNRETPELISRAIPMFQSIKGYKDSDDLVIKCQNKIKEIKEKREQEKKAEIERIKAEMTRKALKKKKIKKILCIVIPSVIVFNLLWTFVVLPAISSAMGNYFYEISFRGLESFEVPEGKTEIKNFAFNACFKLESVTIPSSVRSIGGYAFNGCSSLTTVNIPDSVTSIGSCAFSNCTSLRKIVIPESVTEMGNSVFVNCPDLTIYCEAEYEPYDWDYYWYGGADNIVWGYDGD